MSITTTHVLAAILIGAGLSMAVTGALLRIGRRQQTLLEMLDLPGGEGDVPIEVITESPEAPPISRLTVRIGDLLGRIDTRGSLTRALARAEIPMRAGEYLFLMGTALVVLSSMAAYLMGSLVFGLMAALLVAVFAWFYPRFKAGRRKEKLRQQLPHAFSLIASSVASGHTFLRSIQILGDEIPLPLSTELRRVVAEVTLGSNLIDALDALAIRSEIVELKWAVKAVRIQQTTGGQLSEILHTLADFMRAREEVHREVKVLTAEGKFSGYVLMALPPLVLGALLVLNPVYLEPMYHGMGLILLFAAGLMLLTGHFIIRRMVKIDV